VTVNAGTSFSPSLGAAAGGVASTSELSAAICTFLEGFYTYAGTCPNVTLSGSAQLEAGGGCATLSEMLKANIPAGVSIPASLVTSIACVGNKLKAATCASASATSDAMTTAFSDCGITISSEDAT
jgi:hypothetical protein